MEGVDCWKKKIQTKNVLNEIFNETKVGLGVEVPQPPVEVDRNSFECKAIIITSKWDFNLYTSRYKSHKFFVLISIEKCNDPTLHYRILQSSLW